MTESEKVGGGLPSGVTSSSASSSAPRSSRARRSAGRRHSSRVKKHPSPPHSHHPWKRAGLAAVIVVPVVLVVVLGILLSLVYSRANRERERTANELTAVRREARQASETVARLRKDIKALTQSRLPFPLRSLGFDQVFQLDEGILESILFSQVGTEDAPVYEYRLVLHNTTEETLFPKVRILLFNALGIQVGEADISDSDDWSRPGNPGLAPRETFAVSGRITVNFDSPPEYFLVLHFPDNHTLPSLPF